MEIINPNEIGVKISTLIKESNEKFYAITPFVKIADWKKIIISIEQAKKKNVSIKFFIREIDQENYEILTSLGVEIFKITGLHTKLYFNETEAIISSMNLYEFSDLHSIDIAILYKDRESYNKIYNYYLKYIKPHDTKHYLSKTTENNLINIQEYLVDRFSNTRISLSGDYLFSRNLIPKFDVFIRQNEMTLKLPKKQVTENEIDELTTNIETNTKHKVKLNNPNESYKYYTWDIQLADLTKFEIIELISNLSEI
ncbi:MAG: hypothetical protein IPK18_12225 [Sphingobacteriales bacterium]|jgi:hypothetical protein|nr:MAG: hypothetical protein IPK18_12225 [Sphingobacteriales bacterium]